MHDIFVVDAMKKKDICIKTWDKVIKQLVVIHARKTTPRLRLCERSLLLSTCISSEFPSSSKSSKNSNGNIRQDFQNNTLVQDAITPGDNTEMIHNYK